MRQFREFKLIQGQQVILQRLLVKYNNNNDDSNNNVISELPRNSVLLANYIGQSFFLS